MKFAPLSLNKEIVAVRFSLSLHEVLKEVKNRMARNHEQNGG
jgi:hypothetical protein